MPTPSDLACLTRLDIPCPPNLEDAIAGNYQSSLRYIAFRWQPAGDEVIYDDGRTSGSGNWRVYIRFTCHPKVAPSLVGWCLGDSDEEALHWLLLDRCDRCFYVGTSETVQSLLKSQHPPRPAISAAEYEVILSRLTAAMTRHQEIEQLIREAGVLQSTMQTWMQQEAQQITDLENWLDAAGTS
ncbi:MAG: hypothetical protein HC781_01660 [Leptolyngbyaceae cyanobacterium CSU_1_4]|nr:hypothetical protein [Leptolyngbyaceae cyanobacterium CSU_1_4]